MKIRDTAGNNVDAIRIICSHAYMYSINYWKFRVYEGKVLKGKDNHYYFLKDDEHSHCKCTTVPVKQGDLWKNIVWFDRRDDKKAASLFEEYLLDKLSECQDKLDNILKLMDQVETEKAKLTTVDSRGKEISK